MTDPILKELWAELKASVAGWKFEPRPVQHDHVLRYNHATGLPLHGLNGTADGAGMPQGVHLPDSQNNAHS
jgi:hypothetical protein